ncbi:hypothetical protein GA0115252_10132, partial [Streptomyces sp. DfronAA-171]
MTGSGYCVLPGGDVIVALTLPRPPCGPLGGPAGAGRSADDASVRVLVRAKNRSRALTRLRNLGLRAVYLRGNTAPPTPDRDHRRPAPPRGPPVARGPGRPLRAVAPHSG